MPPQQPQQPAVCTCCKRFTSMPFKHSFCASLEQTKNQSWQTKPSWIVTPTSSLTPSLAGTTFCSGDCLFSYLFSQGLLSNDRTPDVALHFFKRVDEQRQWTSAHPPLLHAGAADDNDEATSAAAVAPGSGLLGGSVAGSSVVSGGGSDATATPPHLSPGDSVGAGGGAAPPAGVGGYAQASAAWAAGGRLT